MCVIFYQTKEQPLFTYDEILNASLTNPDGMGLMWNDGKSIKYRKGYFNVNDFYKDYVEITDGENIMTTKIYILLSNGKMIVGW